MEGNDNNYSQYGCSLANKTREEMLDSLVAQVKEFSKKFEEIAECIKYYSKKIEHD